MNYAAIPVYHITSVANLTSIFQAGGLLSDIRMGVQPHSVIGYPNIKHRRMTQITVPCCGNAFVGDFVPFYYCPRSVMLFTVNLGKTGKPPGCQTDIVHLVSTVGQLVAQGVPWAISDGNAGAFHTLFDNKLTALDTLDWKAINATYWGAFGHQKAAEFLVRDFVPWGQFNEVACHNPTTEATVKKLLAAAGHATPVVVRKNWYF